MKSNTIGEVQYHSNGIYLKILIKTTVIVVVHI
jgi:hypothetical protein